MTYYAPFYRPTYQPDMSQAYQPYQQPMNQYPQAQPPAANQPSSDFLWVLNENEATSYPVAPNNTVTLWDKNLPTIYIKSVNAQGVPSMRVLDFTERTAQSPAQPPVAFQQPNNFATIEQFNALRDDVEAIRGKLNEWKPKTKKTEAENNG